MKKLARITARPINHSEILRAVKDDAAGGTVLFLGTIRDRNEGKAVESLEYEVYKEMAEKRMAELETMVMKKWPIKKIAMVHRYGRLSIGEVSVAVAVSSEHRAEAFEAGKFAIDTIKRKLPLWKKEKLKSGKEAWTKGVPIRR